MNIDIQKVVVKKTTTTKEKEKASTHHRTSPTVSSSTSSSKSNSTKNPSSSSSRRQPSRVSLSEGDISSDSSTEKVIPYKREAGEMSDRVRANMLQYFGGKKNHERWVMKCTLRVPEPPPPRTIKKIAIAAYENRSIDFFFVHLEKYLIVLFIIYQTTFIYQ